MRSIVTLVAMSSLLAPAASAALITFDDLGLVHGEIMSTQVPGLTISGVNPAQSFDYVSIFDTTETGTSDPDLEDPWSGGNVDPTTVFGNILILAENNTGDGDGILDDPDDQAGNNGQTFRLQFDGDIDSFGFALIDVEGRGENGEISFFDDGALVDSFSFSEFMAGGLFENLLDPIAFGNNFANEINPITSGDVGGIFDEVHIRLAGSAGIDNLVFTPIPAPGVLTLVAGFLVCGRRRAR